MRRSYGEVRDYVKSRAGAVDQTIIENLMVQSLLDMHRDLGRQETLITATLSVTADDAFYDVPATIEKVLTITDSDGCPLAQHQPACSCLSSTWGKPGGVSCISTSSINDATVATYGVDGTVITMYPTPTEAATYTMKGLGPLDTTLYDLDGSTLVWRWVNLPNDLHEAYSNRVLGMSLADFDPARAQIWLGFSGQAQARPIATCSRAREPSPVCRRTPLLAPIYSKPPTGRPAPRRSRNSESWCGWLSRS